MSQPFFNKLIGPYIRPRPQQDQDIDFEKFQKEQAEKKAKINSIIDFMRNSFETAKKNTEGNT